MTTRCVRNRMPIEWNATPGTQKLDKCLEKLVSVLKSASKSYAANERAVFQGYCQLEQHLPAAQTTNVWETRRFDASVGLGLYLTVTANHKYRMVTMVQVHLA
jgi:exoribonuclease II